MTKAEFRLVPVWLMKPGGPSIVWWKEPVTSICPKVSNGLRPWRLAWALQGPVFAVACSATGHAIVPLSQSIVVPLWVQKRRGPYLPQSACDVASNFGGATGWRKCSKILLGKIDMVVPATKISAALTLPRKAKVQ